MVRVVWDGARAQARKRGVSLRDRRTGWTRGCSGVWKREASIDVVVLAGTRYRGASGATLFQHNIIPLRLPGDLRETLGSLVILIIPHFIPATLGTNAAPEPFGIGRDYERATSLPLALLFTLPLQIRHPANLPFLPTRAFSSATPPTVACTPISHSDPFELSYPDFITISSDGR